MAADAILTLFQPFEVGALTVPRRALFLNAEAHPVFSRHDGPVDWRACLACVQGFKPSHDALLKQGFEVRPVPDGGDFDLVLIAITGHKQADLGLIGPAYEALASGGRLVVAGAKDQGIASIEKRVAALLGPVESASKHHARRFVLVKSGGSIPSEMRAWAETLRPAEHVPGFLTAPGMFSFDRVDRGSALLAQHLPEGRLGAVADLGAGWGYLSAALLRSAAQLHRLDLYEADHAALACAQRNVGSDMRAGFHWADVTDPSMLPAGRHDTVLMNPPFHQRGAQQMSLGEAFIAAAARTLKPGGRLVMVANALLPYERTLSKTMRSVRETARRDGFKVIEAQR